MWDTLLIFLFFSTFADCFIGERQLFSREWGRQSASSSSSGFAAFFVRRRRSARFPPRPRPRLSTTPLLSPFPSAARMTIWSRRSRLPLRSSSRRSRAVSPAKGARHVSALFRFFHRPTRMMT